MARTLQTAVYCGETRKARSEASDFSNHRREAAGLHLRKEKEIGKFIVSGEMTLSK